MLKYWYRSFTAGLVVSMMVYTASRIAQTPKCEVLDWGGWSTVTLNLVIIVSIAFMAGRESKP